jgi:uncharacterized HAD superfamily protein
MKKPMINPELLAFDIDGVIADTMSLFVDIARNEYHIDGFEYDDITCYTLTECINIEPEIIDEIIRKLLDRRYNGYLKPISGAPEVLHRLSRRSPPILFVTARSELEPIYEWIVNQISLDPAAIDVIATGNFDGKADVLVNRNIQFFVEDRLETCFPLKDAGVTPVLYRQPWNRKPHPFMEVGNWAELEALIDF